MQLASILRNDLTFLEAKQTAPYPYTQIQFAQAVGCHLTVALESRTDQKFSDAQFVVGGGGGKLTGPPIR